MRLIIIFDIITVITIAIPELKVLINMIITIKDIVKQFLTLGELSMRLFEYFPQMRNSSPHPSPTPLSGTACNVFLTKIWNIGLV